MNNQTIIGFGFRTIWRITDILEDVITSADNILLDLHISSHPTQPHLVQSTLALQAPHFNGHRDNTESS